MRTPAQGDERAEDDLDDRTYDDRSFEDYLLDFNAAMGSMARRLQTGTAAASGCGHRQRMDSTSPTR